MINISFAPVNLCFQSDLNGNIRFKYQVYTKLAVFNEDYHP